MNKVVNLAPKKKMQIFEYIGRGHSSSRNRNIHVQKQKPFKIKSTLKNEPLQTSVNTNVDLPVKVQRCVGQFERDSEMIDNNNS